MVKIIAFNCWWTASTVARSSFSEIYLYLVAVSEAHLCQGYSERSSPMPKLQRAKLFFAKATKSEGGAAGSSRQGGINFSSRFC
jgi:hypothetical protein